MKKNIFVFIGLLLAGSTAFAKLNVVTTTTDLAALVKIVGADHVTTFAVAKGTQDPHQIEAKPSFMTKMTNADLVVAQGLELEAAWIRPLIEGARNPKIQIGSRGYFELGEAIDPIEVPTGSVTRAQGDVHPGGNPHFQLDPIRMGKAGILIAERMGEIDSAHHDLFKANAEAYQKTLAEKTKGWQSRISKAGIKEVITYHKTLSYFLDRFAIKSVWQLEPKPGIPPTASHLITVINEMKSHNIKLVLIENFYDDAAAAKLRQEIPDVIVTRVPVAVDGADNVATTEALIENLVKVFENEGAKIKKGPLL